MKKFILFLFVIAILSYVIPIPIIPGMNITLSDFLFSLAFTLIVMNRMYYNEVPLPIFKGQYKII
ncbi:hypothetical protein R0J90_21150, partial [Micrococcus sp. SIMBA_144]